MRPPSRHRTSTLPLACSFAIKAVEWETPIDRQMALRQAEALWRHVAQELGRIVPQDDAPSA